VKTSLCPPSSADTSDPGDEEGNMLLTLLAFTFPLCLDVFAVSVGVLGGMRLTRAQRVRITVLFMAFEIGMPLLGMAVGAPLTHLTGVASNLLIDGDPANAYQIHAASLGHAGDVIENSFFGRYIDPIIVPLVLGAIGVWMLDESLNDDDDDDEVGKVRGWSPRAAFLLSASALPPVWMIW
jgi:putative Mn2+ efflux pump MntP